MLTINTSRVHQQRAPGGEPRRRLSGGKKGLIFARVAEALVGALPLTSSVLISCWVSSALVEHWVRRPSSRSAQTSIIDCTSSRARRISFSPSAIPRSATLDPKTARILTGEDGAPLYFTGIIGRPPQARLRSQDATLSLLLLRVTKPLINIDNHLGRLYR